MKEVWKDVVGYEGLYQVSNLGRVKSLARFKLNHGKLKPIPERILKPWEMSKQTNGQAYMMVSLYQNAKRKSALVHRLVAEAFIPNPENKPTVNHKNGDKYNNQVDNLEWMTQRENLLHAYKMGLNVPIHMKEWYIRDKV